MSPTLGVSIELPSSEPTNTSFNNTTTNFPNVFIGKIMTVESNNNKIILNNSKITDLQNGTNDNDAVNYSQIKNDIPNIQSIINHINNDIHPILNEILLYLNNLNSSLGNLALSNYGNSDYISNTPATEPFNIPTEIDITLVPLTYDQNIDSIQIIE
jgi:hypothetical protein